MFHLKTGSVNQDKKLHDGHNEYQGQHGFVAKYLDKLLSYDVNDCPHLIFELLYGISVHAFSLIIILTKFVQ